MSQPAIAVERLSKCYRIGQKRNEDQDTLLQHVGDLLLTPYRRLRGEIPPPPKVHWALRDVSFNVAQGETLGIIGHNGAGKSTLLKILSRITHPTSGQARIRGRMASLLEVGTGFHPDLTGRENVFMNAAILGMRRAEINQRFDDIVEFSGVREYIETPIKHYSSGMKVRLAFAVAAHLDPEILVIDEVLAVGDAEFQKKCLSRIEDVGTSGRTVLFVSHNLPAVARLCRRLIVMDGGRVAFDGPTLEGIRAYEERAGSVCANREWPEESRPGDDRIRLHGLSLEAGGAPAAGSIDVRKDIVLSMTYEVLTDGAATVASLHVYDMSGIAIMSALDTSDVGHYQSRRRGIYRTRVIIPGNLLNEGRYSFAVAFSTLAPFQNHLYVQDALQCSVYDPMEGGSALGSHRENMAGYFRPILQWETETQR